MIEGEPHREMCSPADPAIGFLLRLCDTDTFRFEQVRSYGQ